MDKSKLKDAGEKTEKAEEKKKEASPSTSDIGSAKKVCISIVYD